MNHATIFVDGRLIAHRTRDGDPAAVREWLPPLVPVPFDPPLLVVRLALAQCTIVDRCPWCALAPPFHRGWVYDIRPPRVYAGRAGSRDLRLLCRAEAPAVGPYVDPRGYLSPPDVVELGDWLGSRILRVPLLATTFGCRQCAIRFATRAAWASHTCTGVPAFVRRVNAFDGFPEPELTIATTFQSAVHLHRQPLLDPVDVELMRRERGRQPRAEIERWLEVEEDRRIRRARAGQE